MKTNKKLLAFVTAIVFSASVISNDMQPYEKPSQSPIPSSQVTVVGGPVTPHIINVNLRTLPTVRSWQPGDAIKEVPRRYYSPENELGPMERSYSHDNLAEIQTNYQTRANRAFTTPIINQDGQGFTGVNPPDPVLDVGKNYVIQAINGGGGSLFVVIDKATGANVAGPSSMESLGTGQCASGAGDPIILYDESAERWFMQEFSSSGNFMCFYISQTDDPVTGGWFHYGFADTTFPDYPHFGIWPDAYYGAANNASRPVYAFDRTNMLAGNIAEPMQKFSLVDLPGYGFEVATPVDWDHMLGAQAPPAGAPGLLMRHVDEEAHSSYPNRPNADILEIFEFVVDWNNPANSGINANNPIQIDIADFNSWFLDYSTFATVPQPNSGSRLDAIREVILNRLQYINFGSHESIIGVLPTNIDPATSGGTIIAGLRWFELRRTGGLAGSWQLHQEGTYADTSAPTQNRLVGSVSMDVSGNIALAYSMTDTDSANPINASVKYTGRTIADPLGVMSQAETDLLIGGGANSSGRWGDYAAMAVDPVDGCTFWYTSEYQPNSSWGTSISSFKFDACGEPGFVLSSANLEHSVCSNPALDIIYANGFDNVITPPNPTSVLSSINTISVGEHSGNVNLAFNPVLATGISGLFSVNPVAIGNSFSASFVIQDTVSAGTYIASIEGTSAGVDNRTIDITLNVFDTAGSSVPLTAPSDSATNVQLTPTFSWTVDAAAVSYLIEIATDDQFMNIIDSATVTNNSYTPSSDLPSSTGLFWRVTTQSPCSGSTSTVFSFTTSVLPGDCAIGLTQFDIQSYDFENSAQGWTTIDDINWELTAGVGEGSSQAFQADDLTEVSDSSLVSPTINLPSGVGPLTLRFWNTQTIEDTTGGCFDSATLEVSVNGGTFTQVLDADIINDDYDGPTDGGFGHPLPANTPAWCGDPKNATVFNVDVDDLADQDVQFKFRMTSDSSVGRPEGWAIDNVRVTGCQ